MRLYIPAYFIFCTVFGFSAFANNNNCGQSVIKDSAFAPFQPELEGFLGSVEAILDAEIKQEKLKISQNPRRIALFGRAMENLVAYSKPLRAASRIFEIPLPILTCVLWAESGFGATIDIVKNGDDRYPGGISQFTGEGAKTVNRLTLESDRYRYGDVKMRPYASGTKVYFDYLGRSKPEDSNDFDALMSGHLTKEIATRNDTVSIVAMAMHLRSNYEDVKSWVDKKIIGKREPVAADQFRKWIIASSAYNRGSGAINDVLIASSGWNHYKELLKVSHPTAKTHMGNMMACLNQSF